ncbi:TIGR02285 family protein [Desulfopila sp. IMCC35008]|uniref:TIGR02285 family protein n=1 Tax=Desulfopila sp. IMCC35008 TaxID=2653858 RepID=UPI0013D6A328|nr:TIGR02285 family protein [Desulfopila sp. IMCC35008]
MVINKRMHLAGCVFASLIATVLFLLTSPAMCSDTVNQDTFGEVNWYRAIFPPITIPEGKDEGKGFFDRVMNFVIAELPEYSHYHHIANFKRIMVELQKSESSCCPSLYKTKERAEFIEFSIPAVVVLPNGIITTQRNQHKLEQYVDQEGKIKLSALLADKALSLGVSNGRLYSGGIDEILSRHQGAKNITIQSGEDVFYGLMSMMYLGRVDYIIGYPTEVRYHSRNDPQFRESVYFPIQENNVPFTLGYIGCSKTESGQEIIDRVNTILLQNRDTDAFLDYYESWLDISTKRFYRSVVQKYFQSEGK